MRNTADAREAIGRVSLGLVLDTSLFLKPVLHRVQRRAHNARPTGVSHLSLSRPPTVTVSSRISAMLSRISRVNGSFLSGTSRLG
mmetsp:Transcript_10716/g.24635  ORF Transcript_10716/g.24635 Transcript_10716/m.24635 type:complete len:85 (+) Transcript_10716:1294-1548(+)